MEETKLDLLKDLGLGESFSNKTLDLIVKTEHKYVRDLRMNVKSVMESQNLNTLPARLRMNIMMSPVLGKEFFELISLAVSAVNGCEMCVKSHEISVIEAGSTEARVWDAIRLASVITSLGKIMHD